VLPYPSYLRVYEPVAALRGADQDWLRDVEISQHDSVGTLTAEQQTVLRWTVMSTASTRNDDGRTWAYVLNRGGKAHICPVDMSLRSWLSLTSLVDDVADPSLNMLVPAASFAVADEAFLRWRRDHPQAVAHIQQVTWGVPRTWFAMVADDERELYDAGGLTSVRYRTRLVDAGRRLSSAHRILSDVVDDVELLDDLIRLSTWLDAFDDASWVELDYAGVARLLGSELRDDHSARDISRALRALRASDYSTAATAYRCFEQRWRAVGAYERAN
jgi:hypothetical protein